MGGAPYSFFGPQAPAAPEPSKVHKRATEITESVRKAQGPVNYVEAGYYEVDHACDQYFNNLILAQNKNGFVGDVILATGTAGSALESLRKKTEVAARQLARIAAGAAFGASLVDAWGDRALMTPYPSETKTLIIDALYDFRQRNPARNTTTAAEAALIVERYAEICTYSGITRYAKQALTRPSTEVAAAPPSTSLTKPEVVAANNIAFLLGESDKSLTDRQLAILQYYINTNKNAYATPGAAVSLLAELPEGVRPLLAPGGAPADPSTNATAKATAAKISAVLAQFAASNADFSELVAQVGRNFEAAKAADAAAKLKGQNVVESLPNTPLVQPDPPALHSLTPTPAVAKPVRIY